MSKPAPPSVQKRVALRRDRLVRWLTAGRNQKEFCARFKVDPSTVSADVRALVAEGRIERIGQGKYALPVPQPAGRLPDGTPDYGMLADLVLIEKEEPKPPEPAKAGVPAHVSLSAIFVGTFAGAVLVKAVLVLLLEVL